MPPHERKTCLGRPDYRPARFLFPQKEPGENCVPPLYLTGAGRAAQCAAPTIQPEHPGRAGLGPAPTVYYRDWSILLDRSQSGPRAPTVRPYGGKQSGGVGSAKPGANVEPHELKLSTKPGPQWARRELQSITQILRAGNFLLNPRGNPRIGGPGVSRHGERSSPLRRPPASFGSFSTRKRNPLRRAEPCAASRRVVAPYTKNCSIIAPSSVWPDGQPPDPIPSVVSRHHPYPFWPSAISP